MNGKPFARIFLSAVFQAALLFLSACAGPNSNFLGAAKAGDIPGIEASLKAGADVDVRSYQGGHTALMWAASSGHVNEVRLLLKSGADVNAGDWFGNTALMDAAVNGHADVVSLLLKSGANVNALNYHGFTALMLAAYEGQIDIVKILLKNNANVDYKNNNGDNAVSLAKNSEIRSMIFSYIRTEGLHSNKIGNFNAEHMEHLPWGDGPLPWQR